MDIATRLAQLEQMVKEAKSMPLSASVLVSRDELLEVIDGMRKAIPEEIKQARWVVKDREELLSKARRDAEAIVQQAAREQARLLGEQEVFTKAAKEAERLLEEAREQARQMKLEAEDYVDSRLAAFEAALQQVRERIDRTTEIVERGRQKLRGGTIAEDHLGDEEVIGDISEPAPEGEAG